MFILGDFTGLYTVCVVRKRWRGGEKLGRFIQTNNQEVAISLETVNGYF